MAHSSMASERGIRRAQPTPAPAALEAFEYLELYVGNDRQAAHYYRTAIGLDVVAHAGLETGTRDRSSTIVQQGGVMLVLTSALDPGHVIAAHVNRHGDAVSDVAFRVRDAEAVYNELTRRGAAALADPQVYEDGSGRVVTATVAGGGSLRHTLVERRGRSDGLLPGYRPTRGARDGGRRFESIDHVACVVEPGTLDRWVELYVEVFGFHVSHCERVVTGLTAMNSKVVQDAGGRVRLSLVEPAPAPRRSQLDEYLTYNQGPGVQHAALLTTDIVGAVEDLTARGMEWLRTPAPYYDMLEPRIGPVARETLDRYRKLGILMDRDEAGYLMQVFTRPVQGRPTFFLEVIQREGCRGFGSGNIRALFEAVEREQAARGNL